MQVIRECQMRAVILTELAKDAPEFEDQLLYVAKEWLAAGHFNRAVQRPCGYGPQVICTPLKRANLMSQSDWYHDKAAECNRLALASTNAITRYQYIRDRDGWRELPPVLMRQRKLQNKEKGKNKLGAPRCVACLFLGGSHAMSAIGT